MGRESYQVGSSGKGPTGKVAAGVPRSSAGRK